MVGIHMIEKFGFRSYKDGNKKIKEFLNEDYTPPIRQFLQDKLDIPKILNIIEKTKSFIVESEWIEGKDFFQIDREFQNRLLEFMKQNSSLEEKELFIEKEEMAISENYFKWGVFMAKMHNVKNDKGLSVASRDLQMGNVIKADDGRVMLCDYTKLYYTDFPEEEIIRWILIPYPFNKKYKDSFMNGYLAQRNITLDDMIQKTIHINWDNYHDLYCNGKLLRRGPRSNKRLEFLPKDFTGLKVLDLGCSCGMLAREAKRRGAKDVTAIEKQHHLAHRLIDLVAVISYAEGLSIRCLHNDIEDGMCLRENTFDIIFFCAVLGHLKGDRFEYLKMLRHKCKILYFETNLGGKELPHRDLLEKAGYKEIECLGESGDPDRESNSHYTMFKCKGDLA